MSLNNCNSFNPLGIRAKIGCEPGWQGMLIVDHVEGIWGDLQLTITKIKSVNDIYSRNHILLG